MDDSVLQQAVRLHRAGRFAEAANLYAGILRSDPAHFEALHALGIVRYQTGQLEEAERLIGRAIAVRPGAADALFNLGALLQRRERFEEALACFGRAIAVRPDYVEALTNRGVTLLGLGRSADALADFDRVVALRPGFAQAWRNRGGIFETLNRPADALASYERAAALDPADSFSRLKCADLLLYFNRAAEAEAAYGRYLALNPADAQAWNRRGIAAAELKRKEEALACFGKAVDLAPANADYWNNRANAYFEAKFYPEAAADYERALAIVPDLPYAEGYLLQCRLRACEWGSLAEDRRRLAEAIRAGRPVIDPLGNLAVSRSAEDQLACARIWLAGMQPPVLPPLRQGAKYRHDRIRVAYLSADFRLHPVAFLMAGVFEHHNRTRFETIGVSFTPPGASALRTRIEKSFDRYYDVLEKTDAETASLLASLEADIAVDLMGFTDGCRTGILALRPAPVQANYLGFPGTMGARHIDYILADRTAIPEEQKRHYREQVVYLPDSYLPNDSRRRIAERTPSRAEMGLPEAGFVFASFNDAYKIGPDIFAVWTRLLRGVEGSVLWLAQANPAAIANLRREAEARGVAGGRLLFADYVAEMADHLARLRLADLYLDTLPYNAHASACDALWAGLPVLTCKGGAFAGRAASSALHAAGLPELATDSLESYEALALKLARNRQELAATRAKLARNRTTHPLFDTARFTLHLEAAYTKMWERAERGEPPAGFAVEPVAAPVL